MKKLLLASLLCLTPVAAQAGPLAIVTVGAPAINCVFTTASPCTVVVDDSVGDVPLPGGGVGRLQSRTYPGGPGSAAAGLYAYVYRMDLTNAVGITANGCVDWVMIRFRPVVPLDYNGDGVRDQVWVTTSGGLGSVGLASAVQTTSRIKFTFSTPVCGGSAPGKGMTSYFFGLVSKTPPENLTAIVHDTTGATRSVPARVPK